jgi:hypothetical protein
MTRCASFLWVARFAEQIVVLARGPEEFFSALRRVAVDPRSADRVNGASGPGCRAFPF